MNKPFRDFPPHEYEADPNFESRFLHSTEQETPTTLRKASSNTPTLKFINNGVVLKI